jgi:hypothetical protein
MNDLLIEQLQHEIKTAYRLSPEGEAKWQSSLRNMGSTLEEQGMRRKQGVVSGEAYMKRDARQTRSEKKAARRRLVCKRQMMQR